MLLKILKELQSILHSGTDSVPAKFNCLSLTDLIHGNSSLPAAFKAADSGVSFLRMFLTNTAVYSFSPQQETAAFQFLSHQRNHLRF